MNTSTESPLIEALQRSECYPHPCGEIALIETHISWVVLTGEFAYKIKKPVQLDFLDFSTLKLREHFCQEELKLNRRLAAELYLDVVPITGTPQDPQVAGEGEPFEYAIRMQQFPQSELLTEQLQQGQLTGTHIDELARLVADFHTRINQAPAQSRYGTPQSVQQPAEDNFSDLLHTHFDTALTDRIGRLRGWSREEFARRRDVITDRKNAGFVRECHGDMHLGNMLLWNDRVTIFDCIEFNADFRWVDVQSEVAFLDMDLNHRGRPDLAHRFLNAYLEHTGDYAGLSVLRFYLVYRALVRAKVAAIRLRQAGLTRDETHELRHELESYIELAERYTRPTKPALLITHGFSGSGKTFGTECLVETRGAVRIRSDIERKRLAGINPLADTASNLDAGLYSPSATERTYRTLETLAGDLIRDGWTAIVDATFLTRSRRDEFRRLAESLGVPFAILDFQASHETLRERVQSRQEHQQDASEAGTDVLEHQLSDHEALTEDERDHAIGIDTDTQDWNAQLLHEVERRLQPSM